MMDLIEALTILARYVDDSHPTNCEHDVLHVKGPPPDAMPESDNARLGQLSFSWDSETEMWHSFRFGSC